MRERHNAANADGLYQNTGKEEFPCGLCDDVIGLDQRYAKWAEDTGAPVRRICVACNEAKRAAAEAASVEASAKDDAA